MGGATQLPYTVAVVPCHIFSMNDYVLQLQNAHNEVDVCSSFHPYLEGMLPRKRTRSGCSKCVDKINGVASQLIRYSQQDPLLSWSAGR